LNAAFAMAILDLISHVHLPSFVNMLPKYLKHSTFSSCFWLVEQANKIWVPKKRQGFEYLGE
jgi:hypothetical protein